MITEINGHQYLMDKDKAIQVINYVKHEIKDRKAVVAVEKEGYVEFRRDFFQTNRQLLEAVARWNDEGYFVYYVS